MLRNLCSRNCVEYRSGPELYSVRVLNDGTPRVRVPINAKSNANVVKMNGNANANGPKVTLDFSVTVQI